MLPVGIRAARGRIPIAASAVTLFPQPDSPTSPSVSPGADVERDAVHRVDEAAARPEADAQVVDREQRRLAHVRPRSFGSIASRMASPMRLNPITAMTIAMPGKIARNGAVCR